MSAPIVVAGGGPGGATVAALLAMRGREVVLLEREFFPRVHVGESLLPASLPILEALGVLDEVAAAGFTEKPGATMVWGKSREPWSWYFRETNARHPTSFQVARDRFDEILLRNAERRGVDVREGWRVLDALFEGGRAVGVRAEHAGGVEEIACSWLVDATGQAGLIGRRLGLRAHDEFFRNLAVYAWYRGGERLPEPDAGNIFIESFADGWAWSIPLADDVMSVGVVVDSEFGGRALAEAEPGEFLAGQLARAERTAGMLAAAEIVEGPRVVRDWSYESSRLVGDGWILVGDAACFVDPLFSSGVHLAMSSGLMAAAYVHTALDEPEMRGPAAESYSQLYSDQYRQFREMAALFYASNRTADSYFWEARRIAGDGRSAPRQSFIAAVAGQPPQGYERAVLERGEAPAEFAEAVAEVEAERARRRAELGGMDIGGRRPVLAGDVELERRPIIGEERFEWGAVVRSAGRPQGAPVSTMVAAFLQRLDGGRTAAEAADDLLAGAERIDEGRRAEMREGLLRAVGVLYVDGIIERLE